MASMYRVTTVFQGVVGSPWYNTLYFEAAAGTAAQAVTAVGTYWGAMDADMNTSVTWATEADVETVDDATGNITAVTNVTPVTGTGSAVTTLLPRGLQGVVQLRTGVYAFGREIRGRIYIPGITEDANVSGGVLDSAYAAVWQTRAASLASGPNHQLQVFSKTHLAARDVASVSIAPTFSMLRSRRD